MGWNERDECQAMKYDACV